MKQRLIYWCLVVVSLGGFASCKNDPTPDPPQTADRTVLVYMAADNSLSWRGDFGNKNLGQIVRAMDGLKGNMLVYIDLPSEGATLYKIEGDGKTKTVVEKYGVENSASTEVLQRVLNTSMQKYPAKSYGLVLWSHGKGWVPSDLNIQGMRSRPESGEVSGTAVSGSEKELWRPMENALVTKTFGADGSSEMEIPDMAAILPKDRKLDFLIFDACFMSCVEVAYDLRHAAQYIIASPTEIMGDGFPYGTVAPLFFRETLDPQAICSAFVDHYRNLTTPENGGSASIALIKTSEMDALASAARDVFALDPAPVVDAGSVQYLELLPNHVFYDLEDYLSQFASGTSQFEAFQRQLAQTVVYTDHTDRIYSAFGLYNGTHAFPCTRFCGFSTYIPRTNFPGYNVAHLQTAWAQAVGLVQ